MGIGIKFDLNWDCITPRYMGLHYTTIYGIALHHDIWKIIQWPLEYFEEYMINFVYSTVFLSVPSSHISFHLSRLVGKPTMWFPNRSDTNRPVQAQKIARSLKFRI